MTTTTHMIPTLPKFRTTREGDVRSDHVLVTPSGHRLGIGGVARGHEGRKVHQGPMTPGPWAYAYGKCSVMAANPEHGTYGEMKRLNAEGKVHHVATGDHLVFDGVEYIIRVYRRQYIELTKVEKS